jgi:hypothetical protein
MRASALHIIISLRHRAAAALAIGCSGSSTHGATTPAAPIERLLVALATGINLLHGFCYCPRCRCI